MSPSPWERPLNRRKPNTFIIGAPKSGTTSLYGYLREHPDVFMPREKEPEYFAPDVVHMRRGRPFLYPQDEDRYLSLFAQAGDEARVGEASASYLMSRQAPGLIHEFDPDAKIVAMLRNPVDLVYSMHGHRVAHASEWLTDIEEALAADADRSRGERVQLGKTGLGAAYRDYAWLGEQLERWLNQFGSDAVHTIVFNDFVTDTGAEYRKLLEFLSIDPDHRPSFAVHNQRFQRRRGPVSRALGSGPARWVARTAAPAVLGERRTAKLANRLSRRQFTREAADQPPLSPALRLSLEREFASDVALLGRLVGRDLVSLWFGQARP